jgi:hypothetical protein
MAKSKKFKQAHTDNVKHGMGDFYGSGVKNPVGKMRSGSVGQVKASKKQLKNPPKSLA